MKAFKPSVVIMDPVSNLVWVGSPSEIESTLMHFIDSLKMDGITTLFICPISGLHQDLTEMGASSLMDTWISVRDIENNGERNRVLYVIR